MAYTSFQQHANVNMNLEKKLHIGAWVISGYTYIYAHTFFLGEQIFHEIHLLPFAKKFLMLPTKLSNLHAYFARHFAYLSNHTYIFARHFASYLNIHTYLQGIFATYLNIHTYLQGILLPI